MLNQFSRTELLIGKVGLKKLSKAKVAVFGIGGVGSFVVEGLDWFVENYGKYGITSIAFPPLGCGNGGLTWEVVGPIMYQKLCELPIEIEIYAPFGVSRNEITDEFLSKTVIQDDILGKNN